MWRRDNAALVSAMTGEGVEAMRTMLAERLTVARRLRHIDVAADDGAARAWLYAHGNVEAVNENGLSVRLSDADFARYQAR